MCQGTPPVPFLSFLKLTRVLSAYCVLGTVLDLDLTFCLPRPAPSSGSGPVGWEEVGDVFLLPWPCIPSPSRSLTVRGGRRDQGQGPGSSGRPSDLSPYSITLNSVTKKSM